MQLTQFLFVIILIIYKPRCVFPKSCESFLQGPIEDKTGPGNPLFLTPLIEQGKIDDALAASAVFFNGFKNLKSYAGYLTVNKDFNSNLFFWFFRSQTNADNSPVILWLQGGPGASSLIGLFEENGPFSVNSQGGLKLRQYAWTKNHNVLYIDSPVGTGFSFTEGGYCQNETQVGLDLYRALQQFFTLFPHLRENEFFVSGESYGGKYAPAIAYTIHKKNPEAEVKINLKGVSIGNGLSDPVNQLNYADYLYQIGLIDENMQTQMKEVQDQGIKYIQNGDWANASKIFGSLVLGDPNNGSTLLQNFTGFTNHFNFLYPVDPLSDNLMLKYLQRDDVRAAIHVGNLTYNFENEEVGINLVEDMMQSVAPWISELLGNYRVLIYNGQLDIIVAYPLTVNYLRNLNFTSAEEYKTAERYQWYVDNDLAGYVKQAGNLTEVLVRNAGHMVPADQPKWAYDLISRFTRDKSFHGK